MRLTALALAYFAAALLALAFLLLPIVAIFAHTTPVKLIDQLSNPVVRDAFVVSLKTSAIAQAQSPRATVSPRPEKSHPR